MPDSDLTSEGMLPVDAAASGAVDSLRIHHPDFVLLDGEMPSANLRRLIDLTMPEIPAGATLEQCLYLLRNSWTVKGERSDEQHKKFDDCSEEIHSIADELGFCKTITASGHYDFAFVHGASPIERFTSLLDAIKLGEITVDHIIVSTTSSVEIRSEEAQAAGYDPTEIGYMKFIFERLLGEKFDHSQQSVIRHKTSFLDTPKPEELTRAHTGHTIIEFLKECEDLRGAKILGVSHQPYVQYQDNFIRILSYFTGFEPEVTNLGMGIDSEINPVVILDSILKAAAAEVLISKVESHDLTTARRILEKLTLVSL